MLKLSIQNVNCPTSYVTSKRAVFLQAHICGLFLAASHIFLTRGNDSEENNIVTA